ncbi:hypothetical protein H6788_02270 [Candidatus Nomurabacteria bacterium]|nr:hypothetical protein [Candidatus Nomurabacteria bacterium]MCB9819126.1 hypothetical protein [Candidatus Nomurabacteria bacterium]
MLSVGGAILYEANHIDGKRDNAGHSDKAIYLATKLLIPPAEVPLVLETLDKKIDELDKQVDIYSATSVDQLRTIRKTVHDNALRSAEADKFARALFAKMGIIFDSADQLNLGIGADGTMTDTPARTARAKEDIDPAIADHTLHAGGRQPNGHDKTAA